MRRIILIKDAMNGSHTLLDEDIVKFLIRWSELDIEMAGLTRFVNSPRYTRAGSHTPEVDLHALRHVRI